MSSDEIIRKINEHVGAGLDTEADVSYLLVQLGKLIERDRLSDRYPIVDFYRNWVCHPQLRFDANQTMGRILGGFDEAAKLVGDQRKRRADAIGDNISLTALKTQLDQLFTHYPQFDRAMIGYAAADWQDFDDLLLGIVADIPLGPYLGIRRFNVGRDANGATTLTAEPHNGDVITVRLQR
jgi:hypothetical protein